MRRVEVRQPVRWESVGRRGLVLVLLGGLVFSTIG